MLPDTHELEQDRVRVMEEIMVPVLGGGGKLDVVVQSELILDSNGKQQLSNGKPQEPQYESEDSDESLSMSSHWHPKCGCECSRNSGNDFRLDIGFYFLQFSAIFGGNFQGKC